MAQLIRQYTRQRPISMSNYARTFGLIAAIAMGFFSAYIFFVTGDWVAAVFFIGSLSYSVVFLTIARSASNALDEKE